MINTVTIKLVALNQVLFSRSWSSFNKFLNARQTGSCCLPGIWNTIYLENRSSLIATVTNKINVNMETTPAVIVASNSYRKWIIKS